MQDYQDNTSDQFTSTTTLPDGFCVLDVEGRLTQMNDQFAHWAGHPKEKLIGVELIRLLGGQLSKKRPDLFSRAMDQGTTTFFASFMQPEAPQLFWRAYWEAPHLKVHVMHLKRDLLDVSRQSKDVMAAQLGLFEQNDSLNAQKAQWERFISVASHDLHAPLRKVLTFGQIIEKRYSDGQEERFKAYVDHIIDNTTRMQSLLNTLLSFLRMEKEHYTFSDKSFNLMVERAARRVNRADSQIRWPKEDVKVCVNGKLVETLLDHLLDNATRYVPADKTPEIDISFERQAEHVRFTIQDNGIGVQPQHQEKIFDVFVRIKNQGIEPGHGIGLALCKQIVQIHGGQIGLTSDDDGTRFWFSLPVASTQSV